MFAIFMVIVSLFLISQFGSQTKSVEGVRILVQPRFWPAISLGGMLIFSLGYLIQSLRDVARGSGRTQNARIWQAEELLNWLRTFEYAAYFLIYVMAVPRLGYLPATLVFCVLLTLRAGYRDLKSIGWVILGGVIIVVVFKSLLNVKLPAGAVYNFFPEEIGSIFIKYF
jgi:hypothetical protein